MSGKKIVEGLQEAVRTEEGGRMTRVIIMHSTPPINADGTCRAPRCCDQPMQDDGGCSEGCCDDFRCAVCGRQVRVEWPD